MFKRGNYLSWHISQNDYPYQKGIEDQIKYLLGYAILAPSAFNAQPWKCRIKNNLLEVFIDRSRMLKTTDKLGRFSYIAIGCFIKNLQLAAENYGWNIKLSIKITKSKEFIKVAELIFQKSQQKILKNSLFAAIITRTTNRSNYHNRSLPASSLTHLQNLDSKKVKFILLENQDINKLSNISAGADQDVWGEKERRFEHSLWVRHNLTGQYDGMPAFGMGIGLIPSFFAKIAMRNRLFPRLQIRKNIKALKSTRYFGIILGYDKKADWVEAGIVFENLALTLAKYHLVLAPMGALIESQESREALGCILNINIPSLKPQLFLRIGYPTLMVAHSPRLPVQKILI